MFRKWFCDTVSVSKVYVVVNRNSVKAVVRSWVLKECSFCSSEVVRAL